MRYGIASWLKEFRGMTVDPDELVIVAFIKTDAKGVKHCVVRRKGRNEYINMFIPAMAIREKKTGPEVIEDCKSFEDAVDRIRERHYKV